MDVICKKGDGVNLATFQGLCMDVVGFLVRPSQTKGFSPHRDRCIGFVVSASSLVAGLRDGRVQGQVTRLIILSRNTKGTQATPNPLSANS